MDKVLGVLGVFVLVPFVFPVVAVVYSVGLGTPLWRAPSFIAPSLAATMSLVAVATSAYSVYQRDNEHGIFTFVCGINLIGALVVFGLWWFLADRAGAMAQAPRLACTLPVAVFVLGWCGVFGTLTSPYPWLRTIVGDPVYDFPYPRDGEPPAWDGEWRAVTVDERARLEPIVKELVPSPSDPGSPWSALEARFDVHAKARGDRIQLRLRSRSTLVLTWVVVVREDDGNVGLYGPTLPSEPIVDDALRATAERALAAAGALWMLPPLGGGPVIIDGNGGLANPTGNEVPARVFAVGDRPIVVVELDTGSFSGSWACPLVDVTDPSAPRVTTVEVIGRPGAMLGRWLTFDEVSTLDETLRTKGNLGERGDLTSGLRDLAARTELYLAEQSEGPPRLFVTARSREDLNHYVTFVVDMRTRAITDVEGEGSPVR